MNVKRYRAHRALVSVILGWVTLRVVAVEYYPEADVAIRTAMVRPSDKRQDANDWKKIDTVLHPLAPPLRATQAERQWAGQRSSMFISAPAGTVPPVRASVEADKPMVFVSASVPDAGARPYGVDGLHNLDRNRAAPARAMSDRLDIYGWIYVRDENGSASYASQGQLGASQAGLRATYLLIPGKDAAIIALSGRLTRPLGDKGGAEAGLGLEIKPDARWPVSVIAERRIALEQGGRDAWAVFATGGIYRQPVGAGWHADGYAQAGMVGARQHDKFLEGSLSLSRPMQGKLPAAAGVGIWGGAQPGVERIDIGPRLGGTIQTRLMPTGIQWELSGRIRILGEARPGSGLAFTIASGF